MSADKRRSNREPKKAKGALKGKKQRRQENYDYGVCPVCQCRVILRQQRCFNKGKPALMFFAKGHVDKFFECVSKGDGRDCHSDRKNFHWACDKCIKEGKALLGNPSSQKYCDCWPYYAYFDETKTCLDCKCTYVFEASEQKYWYENLKFWVQSRPKYCKECTKVRKGRV